MNRVMGFLDNRGNFLLAALFCVVWLTLSLWPAAWWMDVKSVRVLDAKSGQPVTMIVDRQINREFRGYWVVELRYQSGSEWIMLCNGTGNSWYRPSSRVPDPLTLAWWMGGDCAPTMPGVYRVDTTWRIVSTLWPDRYTSIESNTFTVVDGAAQ